MTSGLEKGLTWRKKGNVSSNTRGRLPKVSFKKNSKSFEFGGEEIYKVENIWKTYVSMARRMPPIISDVLTTFDDFSDVLLTNPVLQIPVYKIIILLF